MIALMLPLRREVEERWAHCEQLEGEVVGVPKTARLLKRPNPDTSPSPRKHGSPPPPTRMTRAEKAFDEMCPSAPRIAPLPSKSYS